MRFALATLIAALSLSSSVFATPVVSPSLVTRNDPPSLVVRNDPSSCVTTVSSAVVSLNVSISADLEVIVSAVAINPAITVIPEIQVHILKIIAGFNTALASIIPATFAAPFVLADAEIALLFDSITIFNALILNLKAQIDYILITVQADTLLLIKAQLKALSSIASALATNYVDAVTDIITAATDLESQLLSEAKDTIQAIDQTVDNLVHDLL